MKKWGAASLAMQYSWTLLFSLLLPLLAGIWLDKRLNTIPLFILIGAALGILAATLGVARMAVRDFSRSVAGDSGEGAGADLEEEPD
jgi:F0F1-type ATP synthase assembly protein I